MGYREKGQSIFYNTSWYSRYGRLPNSKIDDTDTGNMLSSLGQDIFNHAVPYLRLIRLTDAIKEDFLNIRERYRSKVKSKNEIRFAYVTSENEDKGLFNDFKIFPGK